MTSFGFHGRVCAVDIYSMLLHQNCGNWLECHTEVNVLPVADASLYGPQTQQSTAKLSVAALKLCNEGGSTLRLSPRTTMHRGAPWCSGAAGSGRTTVGDTPFRGYPSWCRAVVVVWCNFWRCGVLTRDLTATCSRTAVRRGAVVRGVDGARCGAVGYNRRVDGSTSHDDRDETEAQPQEAGGR